jgi:hypothetical protein
MAIDNKRLCRYVSKIEDVVKNQLDDTLPLDAYPYIRAPPPKGSTPAFDAKALTTSVAMHGAHGEVVNRYTAEALSSTGADPSKVQSKATKRSRFAKDNDTAGAGGAAASGSSGAATAAEKADQDFYKRFLDVPKARTYEGGRIVVFFIGGVTQMEVAGLEKLSKELNREIIVGGTSLLTARDFLEQLEMTDPEGEEDDYGGGGGSSGGGGGGGGGGFGAGLDSMMKESGVDDF